MVVGERRPMSQTVRFQETLRRLAMIDEGFVEDEVGLGLGPAAASALDPKTVALLQVGVSVALGSPAVCLEWSAGRALAAGASEDEIAVRGRRLGGRRAGRVLLAAERWAERYRHARPMSRRAGDAQ